MVRRGTRKYHHNKITTEILMFEVLRASGLVKEISMNSVRIRKLTCKTKINIKK